MGMADECVEKIETEVIIFTDGSTDGSQNKGGAGVYIKDRRTDQEWRLCYAAGEICSSYGAEGVALLRALVNGSKATNHRRQPYVQTACPSTEHWQMTTGRT